MNAPGNERSTERDRALPYAAVVQVADARRRRRERVRAVAAPTAVGLLTAGLAAGVVVAVQVGAADRPPITPAAPPSATATPPAADLPFDPSVAQPGYVEDLALALAAGSAGAEGFDQAQALADAWGVPLYPEAKAITAKAALLGEPLAIDDATGGDRLAERFAAAGYTDQDAEDLADAWSTDPRTAAMLGALVAEAG